MIRDTLTKPRVGQRDGALAFAMRFQQFTPPVMVKGVEDTAFYRYNRLASLNEVGESRANSASPRRASTART